MKGLEEAERELLMPNCLYEHLNCLNFYNEGFEGHVLKHVVRMRVRKKEK